MALPDARAIERDGAGNILSSTAIPTCTHRACSSSGCRSSQRLALGLRLQPTAWLGSRRRPGRRFPWRQQNSVTL